MVGDQVTGAVKLEDHRISYWRSEILQAMFWLKEEGIGDHVDSTLLERYLGVDSHIGLQYLGRLVDEGYIEHVGDRYKLSAAGARKGERDFVASFEELMKPTQCTCWESWWNNPADEEQFVE